MGLFSRAVDRMVSEKVPHKRRRRMIVFVAILTLLSMVTSTVAWFSVNTFAGVDKIDVHISVAAQLRVSMEDHGSDINYCGVYPLDISGCCDIVDYFKICRGPQHFRRCTHGC